MNVAFRVVAIGSIALASLLPVASAEDAHKVVAPNDVQWGPAPAVLPPERRRPSCLVIRQRKVYSPCV